MSVLVVDDAAIMRIVLTDILVRNCGFEKKDIVEATGGNDAIKHYKKEKPEFVLCDISMPDMNGIDVVKALIEFDQDAKIIMCTASSDRADVQECINAGAKDYIVKPPKPERLTQAVAKIRGRETTEQETEQSTESQSAEIEALRSEVAALKKEIETLKQG